MDEKGWRLRWLVPGMMQFPVCFVLMILGFKFGDLKSLVMFLYAFPNIILGFKAFFHKNFDEIAKDHYWPIAIFGAVIQLTLQIVGFYYVADCVFKQYDNKSSDSFDEETPTGRGSHPLPVGLRSKYSSTFSLVIGRIVYIDRPLRSRWSSIL